MNPIASVYLNPLIPEGDYWVRLSAVEDIPFKPGDVSEGWVAALVIETVHPELSGTELRVAVHGTEKATPFRLRFREHFRCFDYPATFAIGRWAKVQIVHAEFGGKQYAQVWFPELSVGELNRAVYAAAGFERQFETTRSQT